MEEWIRVELEKVCSKVGSNYQPKESSNLPYVGLEHIESEKSMLTNHGFESEIKSSKTRFKKGQILYGKLRPYLDKAVIAPFDGICSTDILVFDSNTESMNEFLIHLIHSNEFVDHAKATTNGVQHPRTSWNSLKQFNFLLPPLSEQRKIAHVLSTVRKAIEQQDKLIRTTTELKKALMQKLFTRGTRGEPQKQTEIGLVPESWEVVKINEIFNIQQGKQVSKSNRVGDNQKSFLRTANIFWGKIDFNELDKMHFSINEETKFTLLKEDLLVCEGGDVGRTAICNNNLEGIYYQNHLHRLRAIIDNIIPRYFMYWMMYFAQETTYVKDAGNRTTIPNLSKSRLGNLLMLLPNFQIQKEITDVFFSLDKKIAFQDKKKQTITALFKTMLHELMTGQRRVHKLEFENMEEFQ